MFPSDNAAANSTTRRFNSAKVVADSAIFLLSYGKNGNGGFIFSTHWQNASATRLFAYRRCFIIDDNFCSYAIVAFKSSLAFSTTFRPFHSASFTRLTYWIAHNIGCHTYFTEVRVMSNCCATSFSCANAFSYVFHNS